MSFIISVLAFLTHFVIGLLLLAGFAWAYARATPLDEYELVRKGNAAAALSLAGAFVGYAIVTARIITVSGGLMEVIVWGLIGLGVQVAGHFVLRVVLPNLTTDIEEGRIAPAAVGAALAIALGLLNAASMTP